MSVDWYLGLDLGKASVGWACTDKDYNVLKVKGKSLWGSRLFSESETCEKRRLMRCSRRSRERASKRIELLQGFFSLDISEVDPEFFLRLKQSNLVLEDRKDSHGNPVKLPWYMFCDKDYTDSDYHKQYPTIYHLRHALMHSNEKMDIRLYYLALHHMLLHRGHFLYPNMTLADIGNYDYAFGSFASQLELYDNSFSIRPYSTRIKTILEDKSMNKTSKSEAFKEFVPKGSKTVLEALMLLAGSSVNLKKLFSDDKLVDENGKALSLTLSCDMDMFMDSYGELLADYMAFITEAKTLYDWFLIKDLLLGCTTYSEGKVMSYEKHRSDLQLLKALAHRDLTGEAYRNLFNTNKKGLSNYVAYTGHICDSDKKKGAPSAWGCSKDSFYQYLLKNVMPNIEDCTEKAYILESIESGDFLPKQSSSENSVLPNQLVAYEYENILDRACRYYPQLDANRDKLLSLISFQIPYYVGTTSTSGNNPNQWSVRKTNEQVLPWNIDKVIDMEQTMERFIRRMTSKCTYLYQEDVLPKDAPSYEFFTLLNEINKLSIDGTPIDVEQKQTIVKEYFCRTRTVSMKSLRKYLVKKGYARNDSVLSGLTPEFKTNLASYIAMTSILGNRGVSMATLDLAVESIVLFGSNREVLHGRLKKILPRVSSKKIDDLMKLRYSGYGKLSAKLLTGIRDESQNSILDLMWSTNSNLMEILYADDGKFNSIIDAENSSNIQGNSVEELMDAYGLPTLFRRPVYQAVKILKELIHIMGSNPKKVFIEVTRAKDTVKRDIVSRRDFLNKCMDKKDTALRSLLSTVTDAELRKSKIFLYFVQGGRCMYTGESIDFNLLRNSNRWDIDHIYPQSKVRDNSLDNMVLVNRVKNGTKSDTYPLSPDIQMKMSSFWKELHDRKLISAEKLYRLSRTTDFSNGELACFINRDLVETSWVSILTMNLMKELLPSAEVIPSSARNVSEFRARILSREDLEKHGDRSWNLSEEDKAVGLKLRNVNDLHHAKDAYLNIVVGNVYNAQFTANPLRYVSSHRNYTLNNLYYRDIRQGSSLAWEAGSDGTISTVVGQLKKNDVLVSRKVSSMSQILFNATLQKKDATRPLYPLKGEDNPLHDTSKYGGYTSMKTAYASYIEYEKKGKKKRALIKVSTVEAKQISMGYKTLESYCESMGFQNVAILNRCIPMYSLVELNGYNLYLTGFSNDSATFNVANQLLLPVSMQYVLADVEKAMRFNRYDSLDSESIVALFDSLGKKLTTRAFNFGARHLIIDKWEQLRESFIGQTKEVMCKTIEELLTLFNYGSPSKILKLSSNILKKIISVEDSFKVLNVSTTGFYVSRT